MKAVLAWLAACVLAFLLAGSHLLDSWHAWGLRVSQAQAAETARLQRQARLDYTLFVQAACGPETWYRDRRDGARVCTDKHGRPTGRLLAGANP